MKITVEQIAADFSKHNFENAIPHFSDNIQWNMVGGTTLSGKNDIIKSCNESAQYLSSVKTNFIKFESFSSKNAVIIDSLAVYIDAEQKKSKVASCDIYTFAENKLLGIVSYCIEIND